MKSRIIYIVIIVMGFFASPVYADYIQGHIVRIDRDNGEIFIVLHEECTGEHHVGEGQEAEADNITDKEIIRVVAAWFPRCLSKGMLIYVRGFYLPEDHSTFKAVDVFPRKRRGGKDETGVRCRFRHGQCSSW